MKRIGVIVALAFLGCNGARDSLAEKHVEELRVEVAALRDELRASKQTSPAEDTKLIREQIHDLAESIEGHEGEIVRLEAIAETGGHFAGWWCGVAEVCGRTQHECATHDVRTLAMRGPQATGSDCVRQKTAWCARGDGLIAKCVPSKAKCRESAACVETE